MNVEKEMENLMNESSSLLFWLDCEMTGLDVESDLIIEIGVKVTDAEGENLHVGPSYVIHASVERLEMMGSWCKRTHSSNGLWDEVIASSISMKEAEDHIIAWMDSLQYDKVKYLAGSSIWCDRMFLKKLMPNLDAQFHYRMLDVSSLKWVFTHALDQPYQHPKSDRHRVMEDVDGSIKEYQHYLESMRLSSSVKDNAA